MTTLYEIIAVATDVVDMSINQLTANPKVCETLVQRVQNIGRAWDEHPDWHGRNWYVQVLLAIASLSRVVEWCEAEKQFWNFDDNDDEQEEPLTFVMKPAEEEIPATAPARPDGENALKLSPEDEGRLRMSRTTSNNRRSRDEATKEIVSSVTHKDSDHSKPSSVKFDGPNESARVLATERLRLQAETAQSQNIVMELSLDGDHFIWINYAWHSVIGWVFYRDIRARLAHISCPVPTQRITLARAFRSSSLPRTGTFSGMRRGACKRMMPTPSKSSLGFEYLRATTLLRLRTSTSGWRAAVCS